MSIQVHMSIQYYLENKNFFSTVLYKRELGVLPMPAEELDKIYTNSLISKGIHSLRVSSNVP